MTRKWHYLLCTGILLTLFCAGASMAVEVPVIEQAGRWPYGHVGPVTGDPSRELIFAAVGGVVVCLDAELNKISECVFPGVVKNMRHSAGLLYVSDNKEMLIIDVKDPQHPLSLGLYPMAVDAMTVSDRHLYTVADNTLRVLDAAASGQMATVASLTLPVSGPGVYFRKIYLDGGALYLTEDNQIVMVDVSDPVRPFVLGAYPLYDHSVFSGAFAPGVYVFTEYNQGVKLRIIDLSNPASPVTACDYPLRNQGDCVYAQGDYVYVSHYFFGLEIINIADPYHPVTVGKYFNYHNHVSYQMGRYLYFVLGGAATLYGIDMSDPAFGFHDFKDIQLNTRLSHMSVSKAMACAAYRCDDDEKSVFLLIDITDPAKPRDIGKCALPSDINNDNFMISHDAGKAVAATDEGQLVFLDISDPADPKITGRRAIAADNSHWLNDVVLSKNHLFAATQDGLSVFDVSDPAAIRLIGQTADNAYEDIHKQGDHLYLKSENRVHVYNVSDPTQPREAAVIQRPGALNEISVEGPLICLSEKGSYSLYDISTPGAPVFKTTRRMDYQPSARLSGTRLYCGSYEKIGGLFVYDIADPQQPKLLGSYDMPTAYSDQIKYIDGAYVFAASSRCGGLRIINTSDVATRSVIKPFTTPYRTTDIHLSGGYAYTVDGEESYEGPFFCQGMRIFDLSDPGNPGEMGYFGFDSPNDSFHAVAVKGQYAYGVSMRGLETVDVSDPMKPVAAGITVGDPSKAYDIKILGDRLFSFGEGLTIYDISSPGAPVKTAALAGHLFALDNNTALTATADALALLDISGVSPTTVSTYQVNATIRCAALKTPYAYIITLMTDDASEPVGDCFFRVIDFSNPAQPVEIGKCALSVYNPPLSWGRFFYDKHTMQLSGHYAYIPNAEAGVQIVHIGDPRKPYEALLRDTPGEAYDVAISDGFIYVADGHGGLVALKVNGDVTLVACGKTFTGAAGEEIKGLLACDDQPVSGFDYVLVSEPQNGAAAIIDPKTGAFVYTPAAGFTGADHFSFCLTNGTVASEPAAITITVNDSGESSSGSGSGGCFIRELVHY